MRAARGVQGDLYGTRDDPGLGAGPRGIPANTWQVK